MARIALEWSAADLASKARLGYATVARFEAGGAVQGASVEKMRATLAAEGIEFVNGGRRAGVTYLRRD